MGGAEIKMTTPTPDGSHRRSATRAPVGRAIKLQFDDSMDVIEGHCRNVSIGGMFISFDDGRPAGSLVRFELELEDDTAVRGLGEVVWMRSKNDFGGPEPGFGLKFRFLEQRDRQMIFKLVSQHIKERLSKREPAGHEGEPAAAPAPSPAQLGVAVPLEPSASPGPPQAAPPAAAEPAAVPPAEPPAVSDPLAELELPPELELPFEPPPSEPETAVPSFLEPEPPAADSVPAPPQASEELLAELESPLVDTGSRPAVSPADDPFDLVPSEGQTPMYELGLEPDLPVAGERLAEPEGPIHTRDAGEPERVPVARPEGVAAAAASRRFSLLPVVAVVLIGAAAVLYLYKDRIFSGSDGQPSPIETASVGTGAAGEPEPAAPVSGADPEASSPGTASPGASPEGAGEEESQVAAAPPAAAAPAETTPAATPPPAAPQPATPPPPVAPSPAVPQPAAPPPPPAESASRAEFSRVVDLTWSEAPGGMKVIITGDGPIPTGRYKYFHLGGADPREVIKLLGVSQGYPKSQMTVGGSAVRRIRVGFHGGNELHVVLDLSGPTWQITGVESVGNVLELTLSEP